ncbi:MAG: glycosyltransferase family 4 protein, partial [Pontixanthobacter sp.]
MAILSQPTAATPLHIIATVNAAWNMWHFRRHLLEALLADGHRVTVLAPPDDSVADIVASGCRFLPLKMNRKGLNPVSEIGLWRQFRAIFRREAPDLVLGFTIKNNLFGARAAHALGIPFIPNVTGLGTAFLSGGTLLRVAKRLYRDAFTHCPIVFFQNNDDADLFVELDLVGKGQVRLLSGSGIDLSQFAVEPLPDRHEPLTFLMIARLLRDKGVHEYAQAARRMRSDHPHARFRLLGAVDNDNRSAIPLAQIEAWEAEGIVEYCGTCTDVRPAIASAHCIVLPSYREGAPRTLIEGAAMGRPLIASDVPGCRAVVDDATNGYLCAVRSGDALADAMDRFARLDEGKRSDMGRRSREKMEREFDVAHIIAAYRSAIV